MTLKINTNTTKLITSIDPFYSLNQLCADLITTESNLITGYSTLDARWKIPNQALTIIAGRPSHGKTTLLLNLLTRLLEQYPTKTVLFCSYETSKKQLLLTLFTLLSKTTLDPHFNQELLASYLTEKSLAITREKREQLDQAKARLDNYINNKRLALIDQHLYIDELINFIRHMKDSYPVSAVFIDYIQKIKTKERYSSRQLEIQTISEKLLEAAITLSLPIILGAQFNREVHSKDEMDESKLREAGDIEQDAHSILGIWNHAKEERTITSHSSVTELWTPLTITLLKNRAGSTGDSFNFFFHGPTMSITERSEQNNYHQTIVAAPMHQTFISNYF